MRALLALGLFSLALHANPFDLEELTVVELQARMASGQETARSIVDKYLTRIDAIDRNGPALGCVLELNPDARAIADNLDAERKAGKVRGPLHGIPILIKDNIATADKMQTTAGSLALVGAKAPADAFIVSQLRKAGAVILGKANLSEWANIRSSHASSGWSARGGQTKNPYALDRSPSGSSSGSAVCASANLAALTIGTETDGSIVSPASMNGVVGIKPTVGLVSRMGIIPISHVQDTAGPITRSVSDAAVLLSVMAGSDAQDSMTKDANKHVVDYVKSLDVNSLKGARIGVARKGFTGNNPGTDKLFEAAIADLKRAGATVVDPSNIDTLDQVEGEFEALLYELKADLNIYLSWLGPSSPVHTLEDIIAFNKTHADAEMPFFDQELFEKAQTKGPLTSTAYKQLRTKLQRLAREEGIDKVMTKFRLDAIIAPTGAPAFLIDHIDGDSYKGGSSTIAAIAGYPHITVPAGFVDGLPVGLSFFGRAWSEAVLIKLAYAYEQATKHRKAPTFRPSARAP
jgi:amidase